jgi:hypothetical protein
VALTTSERERTRYHLGYLNVAPAASIALGFPRASQALFLVESAMNNLLPEGEDRVRTHLAVLDGIESKLIDAQCRLAAKEVGEITLNPEETRKLEEEYTRWADRLARQLGVYRNPFSPGSPFGSGGSGGINVPVQIG